MTLFRAAAWVQVHAACCYAAASVRVCAQSCRYAEASVELRDHDYCHGAQDYRAYRFCGDRV